MNTQEFKAWFEGFTESMNGVPSKKAWERIKSRVAEITEKPTEIRYFYDHYWRPYLHTYPYFYSGVAGVGVGYANSIETFGQNSDCGNTYTKQLNNATENTSTLFPVFASTTEAFSSLGRADAASLCSNV